MTVTFKELGQKGRLGNVLFQASATIALAKRNNDDYLFPAWPDHIYFNIPKSKFVSNLPNYKTYVEPIFSYSTIPYTKNLNISGYFQSEKYFKDYEMMIKNFMTPKCSMAVDNNICSIHVRRGDYTKLSDCYVNLDLNYYERAMEIINAKKYLVFSDDIKWCKEHFRGNNFEFSEGHKPYQDLSLMSKCKFNIIANSSFSWWGAWLNRHVDKVVVAPDKWFGPKLSINHDTKDLIPDDWIKT